ncbi:chaperonin 10-like protein [Podospora didyma]|uniref:Chaperonin 10-like protein n=1 Tax=Podospora didyma TaxID=330526 RepID=A0AAE0K9X3_9PEZI|nr:chaperonin 10-like protein [Podospora didyma]
MSSISIPPTHPAVASLAPRAPLAIVNQPTLPPGPGQIQVHVTWTSSTPLDLHVADGGLLVKPEDYPFLMGGSYGGTVVAVGPPPSDGSQARNLQPGDQVFGFVPPGCGDPCFQTYINVSSFTASPLPPNLTLQEAVTVSANLVTVFQAARTSLDLEVKWPVEAGWQPHQASAPILIWGAASSVGLYAVQVFRHQGYRNVIAVASEKHHETLRALGATACFDYRQRDVVDKILAHLPAKEGSDGPKVPYILDCIASREETLRPLTRIAERGTRVGILLPVINVHATRDRAPEYEMDVEKAFPGGWKEEVRLRGTRANFYHHDKDFRDHLQPEWVPAMLQQGIVHPNKQRVVEGQTLRERAQNALDILRDRGISGEKLVWRVADSDN